MRVCKIYNCPKVPGRPCCKDCEAKCVDQCLNAPERCGCSEEASAVQIKNARNIRIDTGRILELAKRGRTNKEIAELLGCSASYVSQVTTSAGLRRRRVVYRGGGGNG